MFVVVVSDTHLKATSSRGLPDKVVTQLQRADVILHAGDVTEKFLLDELRAYAPTHAVLGNNDLGMVLPDTELLKLDGVVVGMIHDSGQRIGRGQRMRKRFPTADVVVFGHSHIPWNEEGVDGQLLFNPGSPTQRRAQPHPTIGILELRRGTIRCHEILTVD